MSLEEYSLEDKIFFSNLNKLLIKAVTAGDVSIVKFLLSKGANANTLNRYDVPALLLAVERGYEDVVRILLLHGADPNASINANVTAIYMAALRGDVKIVEFLLENKADPNVAHVNGKTPLYLATLAGNKDLIKLLLDYGADIDIEVNKINLLEVALEHDDASIARMIYSNQEYNDNKNFSNFASSFSQALSEGKSSTLKKLAHFDPDKFKHVLKKVPDTLAFAVSHGYYKIVDIMLENGADPNSSMKNGDTALYIASINGYVPIIKSLIKFGADIELAVNGYTPLCAAVISEQLGSVKVLLENGAKTISDNEFSPLYKAETIDNKQIARLVRKHYLEYIKNKPVSINSFSEKTFEVVVVRYSEDLSWIAAEFPNDRVIVYNKGEDDLDYLPSNVKIVKVSNIGYLGGSYLQHIVDNYANLADRTLFLQGHPYDINLFLPLRRYNSLVPSNCYNIIAKCSETTIQLHWDHLRTKNWENSQYSKFILGNTSIIEYTSKYIGEYPPNAKLMVAYGAEFAVDKEKIYSHSLEYYKNLLPEFNHSHPMADHYQERLWDLMLGDLENYLSRKIDRHIQTPLYILNLDSSINRWNKISKTFNEMGILYKRFPAVNGYGIKLSNSITKEEFTGQDIKDQRVFIQQNVSYDIICNPKEQFDLQTNITITTLNRPLNAGEFGIWCSYRMMWEDIAKNNYTESVIFEDDFIPAKDNFIIQFDDFIKSLPLTYDLAYLDYWLLSGSIIPLPKVGKYVGRYSKGAQYYGTWATLESKNFISKMLSTNKYNGALDEMFLEKANNREIEVYASMQKFSNINSLELTGLGSNSEINKMGNREGHNENNIKRNNFIKTLLSKRTLPVYIQENNNIALISMVKDEEDIIFENLVWHFILGFRKFVMVDNLSTDNTKQKIQYFANLTRNHATVFIMNDPIFEHIQNRVITAAYKWVRAVWPEVKWVFPVDADEFWISKNSLETSLENIPNHIDAIKVKVPKYYHSTDFYTFTNETKFYEKLHYYTDKALSNDKPFLPKIALRTHDNVEIEQGNHGAHWANNQKITYIDGELLGLEMREFPIRSIVQLHRKYSNGMQANIKGKETKVLADNIGTHWDAYKKYIEKYGEKASEVKFNESLILPEASIDGPLPIGEAIEIFYEIISS